MSSTSESAKSNKSESCGCEGSSAKYDIYTPEQITAALATVKPCWQLSEDGKYITCKFACKNWKACIAVVNAISEIAEQPDMQHHPDLSLTSYRNLEIRITTNSVNALTKTDFDLARQIDGIAVEFSPKWLKSHPEFETAGATTSSDAGVGTTATA